MSVPVAEVFAEPIVVLDFETTGLSPQMGERVTEVAALRIEDGRVVDSFVSLINCGVRIPAFITGLTGISQAMVDRAPPCEQVMPALRDFIGGAALAAHNASFDEKFLLAEYARLDLAPGHGELICSMKLARRIFPGQGSYKLGMLADAFGLRFQGNAHRAQADAEVTVQLLHHIGAHLRTRYALAPLRAGLLAAINGVSAARTVPFLQAAARQD